MAKRDPEKTKRNKLIAELTSDLNSRLSEVLKESGFASQQSLHGCIGQFNAKFIDVKNAVIPTPEIFLQLWMRGCLRNIEALKASSVWYKNTSEFKVFRNMKHLPVFRQYAETFLKRTLWNEYESLTKTRPTVEDAELWLGENDADFGLLVAPRFQGGQWENDKSEIRHFKPNYWTIAHVLETGFVIPNVERRMKFNDVDEYLTFFQDILVRPSKSSHEKAIAGLYCDFVRKASDPLQVPLLIPQLRYDGLEERHKYRLDFCVIDPTTQEKVGFELSPASTHLKVTKIKEKSQREVNEEIRENFEREMRKLKNFFFNRGIYVVIFTDEDLADHNAVFDRISKYLLSKSISIQLELNFKEDFYRTRL